MEKELNYWFNKFSDDFTKTELPYDKKTKSNQKYNLVSIKTELPQLLNERLVTASNDSYNRLFILLITGVSATLEYYLQTENITLGFPIFKQEKEANYINTLLPFKSKIDNSLSVKELIFDVHKNIAEAFENQDFHIQRLLYNLGLEYSENDFALFDICVLLKNIQSENYIYTKPNIIFLFDQKDGQLNLEIKFNDELYEKSTILRLKENIIWGLSKLYNNVEEKLGNLELISETEKKLILDEFNSTTVNFPDSNKDVIDLFEEQADLYPDRIVVSYKEVSITYSELREKANMLAKELIAKGVQKDNVVGIMIERSVEMIIGIYGILKSGAGYLPIDSDFPVNRIRNIINDCKPKILLIDSISAKKHSFLDLETSNTSPSLFISKERERILDLNNHPVPDRSLIDYEKYSSYIGQAMVKNAFAIQATRGCPYKCIYCYNVWSEKHVYRSGQHIFDELKSLYDIGVRRFVIIDDIFNLKKKNSSRFFELIIEHKLDIQLFFPNGVRGDILTEEYIDLMIEAGTVNMALALETASPRLQNEIKKYINLEKLYKNIEYISEKYPHVILELFTMHGFPSETEEEAMATLNKIRELKGIHFPYVFIVKAYTGTELHKQISINSKTEGFDGTGSLAYHELTDSLPFDKQFSLKYQAEFTEFFLSKERLISLLPYQLKTLTKDELVQKYNSYLPIDIENFSELLDFLKIEEKELGIENYVEENHFRIPDLNKKIESISPKKKEGKADLKVLFLDLTQYFSSDEKILYNVVEPPLGHMYLLSYINSKTNYNIEGKIAKSRIDFDNYNELNNLINEFNPHVIAIRSLTYYQEFCHQTISRIRSWGNEMPIVIGGPYATSNYKQTLSDPNIDIVIIGEGEEPLMELLTEILQNNKKLPSKEKLKEIQGVVFRDNEQADSNTRIWMLDQMCESNKCKKDIELPIVKPNDLAYTIYTSGSTGKPKGVMVEHKNLTNLVLSLKEKIYSQYDESLKVGLIAPIIFDASVKQIFSAIAMGHSLVLVSKDTIQDGKTLFNYLEKNTVDLADVTPTHLKMLVEANDQIVNSSVKAILVGGEKIQSELLKRIYNKLTQKELKIFNVYGITECTVDSTLFEINSSNYENYTSPPIGKPLANTKVLIIKNNKLLPIGAYGEMHIGGTGVGRGYWNNEELTNEKFISNPFTENERMYASGDIGRYLETGEIEIKGRKDHQVKIRGYRIELLEIENILATHPKIKEVVVTNIKNNDSDFLCAYFTSDEELDISYLKEFIKEHLPEYMVPTFIIKLDEMPKNVSGKLDRINLPSPFDNKDRGVNEAPQTETEEKLLKVWSEVLGYEGNQISINDNFFDIGGQSLKAVILTYKINSEFGVNINLSDLFEWPTIKDLASILANSELHDQKELPKAKYTEYFAMTQTQQRLLFLQNFDLNSTAYNVNLIVELNEFISEDKVRQALQEIVNRHESLRTYFEFKDNEMMQRVVPIINVEIYNKHVTEEMLNQEINEFVKSFDLSTPPLFRVGCFTTPQKRMLVFNTHHIILDGHSLQILKREFNDIVEGKELPKVKYQFRDYVNWVEGKEQQERIEKSEQFWKKELEGGIPEINLPYDKSVSAENKGQKLGFTLDNETSAKLFELAKDKNVTMFSLVASIYSIFLANITMMKEVVFGLPVYGRNHNDLESIIGMFVNNVAVKSKIDEKVSFGEFLQNLHKRSIGILENQDYPFSSVISKICQQKSNPIKSDLIFNQLNADNEYVESNEERQIDLNFEIKADIALYVYRNNNNLLFLFNYNGEKFLESTISSFKNILLTIIKSITEDENVLIESLLHSPGFESALTGLEDDFFINIENTEFNE